MKEIKKKIVREKKIISREKRSLRKRGKTKSKREEAREVRTFVIQSNQVRVGFHFSN